MLVSDARFPVWTVLIKGCSLSCGSITAFSLYGPLFQSHLLYSQSRINTISIVAELATYLPVPLFGLLVDRYGPRTPSLLAAIFFGPGYFLAAFAYRAGPPPPVGANGWPFEIMVLAFVGVGMGTSCMYLGAVTTCAKNFGRGKHKGFALAVPIACFGLSGMWQSQVGSRLLYERRPGGLRGDVDVFRYFAFLGTLLLVVGLVGSVLLRVVDEGELIDEAVEDLERSGLLEESEFFRPSSARNGYGTLNSEDRRPSTAERTMRREEMRKKTWLLNEETHIYLTDRTMWLLTAGFFLVSGPGEAFINNLGTIIGTLYPFPSQSPLLPPTSPATHVSIVAIASTIARIIAGTLSDLLAPKDTQPRHHRSSHGSLTSSLASLDPLPSATPHKPLTISRLTLLLMSTILLSLGQVLLATGAVQCHASTRFWIVSALVGTGYGAAFSLVPIIISCVWGIENFGTNWGVTAMAPAAGAAVWSAVYAAVYEKSGTVGLDGRCYGVKCYAVTFWGMAAASWVAVLLWLWAWRGPAGWLRKGLAV